jgi:hypothetical protein
MLTPPRDGINGFVRLVAPARIMGANRQQLPKRRTIADADVETPAWLR